MKESVKPGLLNSLEVGSRALHAELDGVDDALARRVPRNGRWSILQCIEHVAVSERDLLNRLRRAQRGDATGPNLARESILAQRAADRKQRIEAPDEVRPANRFKSWQDALADFDQARAETLHWLEQFNGELRGWRTDHPLIPSPVNCYEILLLIAAHPERHARQVREIRKGLESETASGTRS